MEILRPNDPGHATLNALREQIAAKRKEIAAVERAPLPDEDRRARIRAWLDERVRRLSETSGTFASANPVPELRDASLEKLAGMGVAMLALMFPKKLEEALLESIPDKIPAGLPKCDRIAAIAQLQDEIEALERNEEAETLRLEDAGHVVIRRRDMSPELVLQIWASREAA